MTAVFLVSSFILAVLFLNERDASNKAVDAKERAIKNYRGAEKWFVTAMSMASNEQEMQLLRCRKAQVTASAGVGT